MAEKDFFGIFRLFKLLIRLDACPHLLSLEQQDECPLNCSTRMATLPYMLPAGHANTASQTTSQQQSNKVGSNILRVLNFEISSFFLNFDFERVRVIRNNKKRGQIGKKLVRLKAMNMNEFAPVFNITINKKKKVSGVCKNILLHQKLLIHGFFYSTWISYVFLHFFLINYVSSLKTENSQIIVFQY